MKRIVTHISPDIDALTSVWLIHRFMRGWKYAQVELVSAGLTFHGMEPDSDPNTIHVDTGFGQFDHHQTSDFTCAARLVYEHLLANGAIKESEAEAVERIVDVVNRYDHFQEVKLHEPDDDIYAFSLANIVTGLRSEPRFAQRLIELTEESLDGILQYMKGKVHADEVIERGHVFDSYWGKTIVLETDNDKAMKIAFFKGFDMVIRYSPHYKNSAFKITPKSKKTLKKLHDAIVPHDPDAQWFYHASGRMLLNASTRDTKEKVTKFTLQELLTKVKSF